MAAETKRAETKGATKYLSSEFLQEVVRKHTGNDHASVSVKSIDGAVPSGENYLSDVQRVRLDVFEGDEHLGEKSLVVKTLPENEAILKFLNEKGIFRREIMVYKKMLPEINRAIGDVLRSPEISAGIYNTDQDDLLIMEDLKSLGYVTSDRQTGLSLSECNVVVTALARLHATSVALLERKALQVDMLSEPFFYEENNSEMGVYARSAFNDLGDVVEDWPGYERFGDKLRGAVPTVFEKVLQLFDTSDDELVVLNHGDLWASNILLRYADSGEPVDARFVDFQVARFASPATDLHYFFRGSPSDEVREQGVDALLAAYHEELCRALAELGCGHRLVTLDWLKEEMRIKMFYAVYVACAHMATFLAGRDDAPDVPDNDEEDLAKRSSNRRNKLLNGTRYKRAVQQDLLYFEKVGML